MTDITGRIANLPPEKRALLEARLMKNTGGDGAAQKIPQREDRGQAPLSFAQERLWFLDQLNPGTHVYNLPMAVTVEGDLKPAVLREAFHHLVARHESLRTTFSDIEGVSVQNIAESSPLDFALVDLGEWPEQAQELEASRIATEVVSRPFDLSVGPLMRVRMLRLHETKHLLLVVMHHIISDGWSMGVLIEELCGAYAALAAGRAWVPEPLSVQYADYAAWQRRELSGERLGEQLAYWRGRLAGLEPLGLPTDRPRPAQASHRGSRVNFEVGAVLSGRLRELGRAQGATLFMVLLAGFNALLMRYAGRRDVAVGVPVSGRGRREVERLIGFFVNTVVVRARCGEGERFLELLGEVREACLGAYAHQEVPFERVVEELHPERDLSRAPLFQVMFSMQQGGGGGAGALAGLKVTPVEVDLAAARFDLTLHLSESGGAIVGSLDYSTDLFDHDTAQRIVNSFLTLLAAASERPDAPVTSLPLVTAAERHRLLSAAGEAPSPPAPSPLQLFELHAARQPEAVAVVCGGRELSYGRLNAEANALARLLRARGLGAESRVGLFFGRTPEMVTSLLGVLKAGAAYVPLDASLPVARLAYLLADSGASVVLTTHELAASLSESLSDSLTGAEAGRPEVVCVDGEAELAELAGYGGADLVQEADGRAAAYVIYTSGSTGRPKGVVVERRQLAAYVAAFCRRAGLREGLGFAMLQPLGVDSCNSVIYPALALGGRLHLLEEREAGDAAALAEYFAGHEVDVLKIAPSHLRALEAEGGSGVLPRGWLVVGGEASESRWAHRVAGMKRGWRVFNHYGPTETTVGVLMHEVTAGAEVEAEQTAQAGADGAAGGGRTVPAGRALEGTRVYVLDGRLEPVPEGVAGELYVGGGQVARGYLGAARLTAERFVPDPYGGEAGARLYRTGDIGRLLRGGEVEFVGRADDQVKVRGYRVEPGEVESALCEHSLVAAAAVAAVKGEAGQGRLVAYVVPAEGGEAKEGAGDEELWSELRSHLRRLLPEQMVPSAFVRLDALPRTPHGKLDRAALPAAPSAEGAVRGGARREARTEAERKLARVWAEVLGLEEVGVEENFFELGGDSILSIRVIARAAREGLRVTPRQIFQHQSVAELAAVIEREMRAETRPDGREGELAAEEAGEEAPLTPIQERFFEREPAERDHYNQAVLLRLRREADAGALRRAVRAVARRHPALRMRFRRVGGEDGRWVQREEAAGGRALDELFCQVEVTEAAQVEGACAQLQRSLDVERGPVARFALIGVGGGGQRLLVVAHHLVVDGVSWRVLLDDLERAYEQEAGGGRAELGAAAARFTAWSRRLGELAGVEAVAGQAGYWEEALEGPVVELAAEAGGDAEGEENAVGAEAREWAECDEGLTRELLTGTATRTKARVQEVLAAGLAGALRRWGGYDGGRLLVDVEGHGREDLAVGGEGPEAVGQLDVSETVGWFTSVFPLPLPLDPPASPQELLARVKQLWRSAPSAGLGYGLLRYVASGEAAARVRRLPEARLAFNYLGQLDTALAPGSLFAPAEESAGPSRSPRGRRRYLLEVSGGVVGGRLRLSISYARGLYAPGRVRELARLFEQELAGLAAGAAGGQAAGAYVPEDFEFVRMGEAGLAAVTRRGEVEELYPLTPLQEGMLFHTLYGGAGGEGEAVYVNQLRCRLRGELDEAAFERAWDAVVARHEGLRAGFEWEGLEAPVQVIRRGARVAVERRDWRSVGEGERRRLVEQYARLELGRGFDVREAPLMRLGLLRVDEAEWEFVWSHHHLLTDGWSTARVLREVVEAYGALRQGVRVRAGRAGGYREYMRWLRRQEAGAAERYWRRELSGVAGGGAIAGDVRGDVAAGAGYGEEVLRLSAERTRMLAERAGAQRVTLNTVVQGAWAVALSRYSGEREVVYGATVSGRAGVEGAEELVGMFINTVPVRAAVEGGRRSGEWLREMQGRQAEARQYEYAPLARVQRWSGVGAGEALFETILVFENYPVEASAWIGLRERTGLSIEGVSVAEHADYPLTIIVGPGAEMALRCEYDAGRYSAEMVRRLLGHMAAAAEELVADGGRRRLQDIRLLSEDEERWLVHVVGAGPGRAVEGEGVERVGAVGGRAAGEAAVAENVVTAFERRAAERAGAPAVVYDGREVSFGELNRRADEVAERLRRLGVAPEVVVGVYMERSPELLIAILGVLKAGGAFLPLDPAYPRPRLEWMVEDTQVPILLTQQKLVGSVPAAGAKVICLDGEWDGPYAPGETRPASGVEPDNLAYILYTSGSTGKPKGALTSHRSLINFAADAAEQFGLDGDTRFLQFASISFDVALEEIFPTWISGGAVVLLAGSLLYGYTDLVKTIERNKVTTMELPSVYWAGWVHDLARTQTRLPDSLKLVIIGGERVAPELVTEWKKHGVALVNVYGLTEVAVTSTIYLVPEEFGEGASVPEIPIGRPMANTEIYLLDEHLRLVPFGAAGELCLGGLGLARGYLNRPGITAEKFIPSPFAKQPGGRLYRTGDLARFLPDGNLEFIGRVDHQIKIRGHRVEPAEVEAVLLQHAAVGECLVMAREDEPGDKRLVAYVVPKQGVGVSVAELRGSLREKLPAYLVPTSFVVLPSFPLSANGKVDRRALPAPTADDVASEAAFVAPRTPVEEDVARIFAEVLGVERVGIYDNFFDLGGHSLLVTQVVSRLNTAFQLELSLRDLFESPTVNGLVTVIVQRQAGQSEDDALAQMLAELEGLSEDEVESALGE